MTRSDREPALRGVRVVEFAEGIAAPYASQILAHLGADVIKIERLDGDWLRHTARASFIVVNKGKRCIGIDAQTGPGRKLVDRLLDSADVFITNFRGPSLDRLALTPTTVQTERPQLVYGRLSAYAPAGELAARGGTDTILQAVSGLMDQIGSLEGGPTRVGFPVIDLVAGRDLAAGILAALFAQARTGEPGRVVDVSLFASASSLLMEAWQNQLLGNPAVLRAGNQNAVHAPGGIYPCRAGTLLALITLRDADWRGLCTALDRPDLAGDPRLSTNDGRVAHRDLVEREVTAALAVRTADDWVARLRAGGITCGAINSVADVAGDASLSALVPVVPLAGGHGPALGVPIEAGGASGPVTAPPDLGEHTVDVLRALGISAAELGELATAGAIASSDCITS